MSILKPKKSEEQPAGGTPAAPDKGKEGKPAEGSAPPPTSPQPAAPSPAGQAAPAGSAVSAGSAGSADNWAKAVAEQVGKLSETLTTQGDAVKGLSTRFTHVEERIKFLDNVCEVLSHKYNPFLDAVGREPFEGGPPGLARTAPAEPAAEPQVLFERVVEHPRESPAVPAVPATPAGAGAEAAAGSLLEPVAPPFPEPRSASPAPWARFAPPPAPAPHTAAALAAAVPLSRGGYPTAHQSFVAMGWFGHMLKTVDAAVLHRFLDFYRDVGWLTDEMHAWMERLAAGIAAKPPHDEPLDVSSLASPDELVRLHLRSLRFLDYLTGQSLTDEQALVLTDRLRHMLEREW